MKEAVVFVFIKDNNVLVEFRNMDGNEEMLIPGGGIEEFDQQDTEDYKVTAMMREVREELGEQIKIKEFEYLGTVQRIETGAPFHVYIVTNWQGEIPGYIVEEGEENARLEWLSLVKARKFAMKNVVEYALQKAEEYLAAH